MTPLASPDPIVPTHTVWIFNIRDRKTKELPAVKLDHDWVLVRDGEGWKQMYRGSTFPSAQAAVEARLREERSRLASAVAGIAACERLLAELDGAS